MDRPLNARITCRLLMSKFFSTKGFGFCPPSYALWQEKRKSNAFWKRHSLPPSPKGSGSDASCKYRSGWGKRQRGTRPVLAFKGSASFARGGFVDDRHSLVAGLRHQGSVS